MHNYKKLQVWNDAINIAVMVYELTDGFPRSEAYGLSAQMRRSAVSIPSNIAEGCGREGEKELNYFLGIATGSSFELESQLIISSRLNYCSEEKTNAILEKMDINQKMIYKLKASLVKK